MSAALDARHTEAALDALPRSLWRWGLVCSAGHSHGSTPDRESRAVSS